MSSSERSIAETINIKALTHHKKIIDFLNNHDIQKDCYALKSRVKSKEGILDKYKRKRQDPKKTSYKIESISDIIGLRFIVLFKQDLVKLVKSIIQILTKGDDQTNPFNNCTVEELIYYKGNVSLSNISHKIKSGFSSVGMEMKEVNSKEGYSSIHIVCKLKKIEGSDVLPDYRIPVEIQIRTIFEDAWGEIDHKYGYTSRRENKSFHPTLDKHLQTLKQFVDACVDYADLVVEESEMELNPADFSKVLNIAEDINEVCGFFKELNIKAQYLQEYKEAIEIKIKAINEGNNKDLINCADRYLGIKHNYMNSKKEPEYDTFSFYCDLNYAICNLISNTLSGIKNAEIKYLELNEIDPNNSLVLMRLGQAKGKLGDFDESIELLKESYNNVSNHKPKFKMKDKDVEYIRFKAPKAVGYHIWLKITDKDKSYTDEEVLELYQDAFDFSSIGFKLLNKAKQSKDYIEYQNNLAFYLTEISKIKNTDTNNIKIKGFLSEIEAGCGSPSDLNATTLHTLLNSYFMLKNKAKSRIYSKTLKNKIVERDYEFDDTEALDLLKFVVKVNEWLTD